MKIDDKKSKTSKPNIENPKKDLLKNSKFIDKKNNVLGNTMDEDEEENDENFDKEDESKKKEHRRDRGKEKK